MEFNTIVDINIKDFNTLKNIKTLNNKEFYDFLSFQMLNFHTKESKIKICSLNKFFFLSKNYSFTPFTLNYLYVRGSQVKGNIFSYFNQSFYGSTSNNV